MTYDPFKRTMPEPKPRTEIFVWAFVKDVRTFTGLLRAVDDERWEVVYLADGGLYKTEVLATRALAERPGADKGCPGGGRVAAVTSFLK
jgi:hypothetical protein